VAGRRGHARSCAMIPVAPRRPSRQHGSARRTGVTRKARSHGSDRPGHRSGPAAPSPGLRCGGPAGPGPRRAAPRAPDGGRAGAGRRGLRGAPLPGTAGPARPGRHRGQYRRAAQAGGPAAAAGGADLNWLPGSCSANVRGCAKDKSGGCYVPVSMLVSVFLGAGLGTRLPERGACMAVTCTNRLSLVLNSYAAWARARAAASRPSAPGRPRAARSPGRGGRSGSAWSRCRSAPPRWRRGSAIPPRTWPRCPNRSGAPAPAEISRRRSPDRAAARRSQHSGRSARPGWSRRPPGAPPGRRERAHPPRRRGAARCR